MNLQVTFSDGLLHVDVPVLDDQQALIYFSSVWTLNKDWRTYRERWMIGTDGKRKSRKSVLAARLDNEIEQNKGVTAFQCSRFCVVCFFFGKELFSLFQIRESRYYVFLS